MPTPKNPHAGVHRRARARIEKLTPQERIELLKEVGILTAEGKLAARYGGEGAEEERGEEGDPPTRAAG